MDFPNPAIIPLDGIMTYKGMYVERLYDKFDNRPQNEHEAQIFMNTHKVKDLLEALYQYYTIYWLYAAPGGPNERYEVSEEDFYSAGLEGAKRMIRGFQPGFESINGPITMETRMKDVFTEATRETIEFIFIEPRSVQTGNITLRDDPTIDINYDVFETPIPGYPLWKPLEAEVTLPFEVMP
jgi:hypothetical protein